MGLRRPAVAALGVSVLVGTALVTSATASGAAASPCPTGKAAVTDVGYVIFAPDGSSRNVKSLAAAAQPGDIVNVLFNVPPLAAGCSDVQLSIASYQDVVAPPDLKHQTLFSSQTGSFVAGGRYEMSATVATMSSSGPQHWQIDFTTGPVLAPPHYGINLIAAARR